MVDGDVIPEQPIEAVHRGDLADIPLLVGATLDEWRLFRLIDPGPGLREGGLLSRFEEALSVYPNAPEPDAAVQQFRDALETRGARTGAPHVWSAFQSSRIMHLPATRLAAAQADAGGVAYTYLFTWRPPAVRRAVGACHGLDIPFVFGSVQHPLALPLTGITASAARLSRKMQHAWLNFARDGRPGNSRLPDWHRYDGERRATMVLGRSLEIDHAPLEAERSLLEEWRPEPKRRRQRAS